MEKRGLQNARLNQISKKFPKLLCISKDIKFFVFQINPKKFVVVCVVLLSSAKRLLFSFDEFSKATKLAKN
jgi:hypothetical protein